MNKSESKYFATAKRMDDALIDLLNEKDPAYITVKEICARAGVNRSTFYLHYETIGDLMGEALEQVMREFFEHFKDSDSGLASRIADCPPEELILITPDYLIPYLSYIRSNRKVFSCMAVIRPAGMDPAGVYRRLFQTVFSPILRRFGIPDDRHSYMMLFYLNGITAIVQEWITGGCRESDAEISGIILDCVRPYMDRMNG